MSIEAVMSRMNQIQSMLAPGATPAPTPPPQPKPASTSFSSQLATAQGSTFAAAAAGTPVTTTTAATTAIAAPVASALPAGTPYAAEITAAAKAHGIDPALLAGLVKQESGFNPDAGSPAGAQGLTQLMPATAASLGVSDVHDPAQALEGGAKYLRRQLDRFGGDVARALAAYNAGPGAVERFGGVPPYAETQNYVRKVQAYAAGFRTASPATTAVASSVSTSPSVHGIV